MIEILIVVVIIAIAAMVLVPMVGSAGSMQVRSAADISVADIEYTQSVVVGKGRNFSVVSTADVKLGHLASPCSSGGGTVVTIFVEPVTGFVSIANRCW